MSYYIKPLYADSRLIELTLRISPELWDKIMLVRTSGDIWIEYKAKNGYTISILNAPFRHFFNKPMKRFNIGKQVTNESGHELSNETCNEFSKITELDVQELTRVLNEIDKVVISDKAIY